MDAVAKFGFSYNQHLNAFKTNVYIAISELTKAEIGHRSNTKCSRGRDKDIDV